jgi:hypothetical protein
MIHLGAAARPFMKHKFASIWQAIRWLAGSPFAEMRDRATRQLLFALLRPGRIGG